MGGQALLGEDCTWISAWWQLKGWTTLGLACSSFRKVAGFPVRANHSYPARVYKDTPAGEG